MTKHFKDNYVCTIHDGKDLGFLSKGYINDLIDQAAHDINRQRDKFLFEQIEKVEGKFENEHELKAFISRHCTIERRPPDYSILYVRGFPVIQWRERVENRINFETGQATIIINFNY